MANPEHLEILKQGVERWNTWRKEHPELLRPDLSEGDLATANLRYPDLRGADLRANLSGADFRRANLNRANLWDADLSGANLFGADLAGANLYRADLRRANLNRSNLVGAHFVETNFRGSQLSDAHLIGAKLTGADFTGANLFRADLSKANLCGAILAAANLSGTKLTGADFAEAKAHATNFDDVDLGLAKGLEAVEHAGPSTIGIDTIYKSHGKIPDVFLRGCGVPEEFIDFVRQMGLRPIEFYSCFISYSTKDQEFAERLHADLQAKGVRCWFAPEEMKGGRKLHEQIDEAIRLHDKLLLILSEHSMASDWVGTEIGHAREREAREKKQMLFPITLVPYADVKKWQLFDVDRGKDSAKEVREYFIPDFSNWKDHDSYQAAFQRLVKDLKSSG